MVKLGLALSGGGFRASLFHLGVLARMAELGLLRHVEVLSTVSGGAILGALYYVRLKRLLEDKPDAAIGDADYVDLVKEMETQFLAGVQRNIRMRTFLNPLKNLRMARADYSRSDRIGELFDEILYRPAVTAPRNGMIEMRHLKIFPPDGPPDFCPRTDNAARRAKVPVLLLNATMLNTGHNWRFEASTMGPPPRQEANALDVDKNWRFLRPPSYEDVTPVQQNVELGLAVAASACVPGVFQPLALSNLYPGRRVELVDGGVHDNQGVQGLQDERCTHFILSDASGQMENLAYPATRLWAVLARTNEILMDRIREEQLFDLLDERQAPTAFIHLRRGLPVDSVSWIGSAGTPAQPTDDARTGRSLRTGFGVDPEVQNLLSRMRTDLDSFTDIEAHSLMLDGYLMSQPVLRSTAGVSELARPEPSPLKGDWKFLDVQRWMEQPTPTYLKHLRVGHGKLFKVFHLSPLTTLITTLVAIALGGLLGSWQAERIVERWNSTLTVGHLAMAVGVLALGLIPWLGAHITWLRFLRWPIEYVLRFLVRGVVPALASAFVWLHLHTFDRLFLRLGRIDRLRR